MRGITVRSRSIVGTLGGALQTLAGGNISLFTELCENSRQEAYELLLAHAGDVGANAIIAMRYDTSEMGGQWTEICAYGTAVRAHKA